MPDVFSVLAAQAPLGSKILDRNVRFVLLLYNSRSLSHLGAQIVKNSKLRAQNFDLLILEKSCTTLMEYTLYQAAGSIPVAEEITINPIKNLAATHVNRFSIKVEWQPPSGEFDYFRATCCAVDSCDDTIITEGMLTKPVVTFSGLQPETKYTISVEACAQNGSCSNPTTIKVSTNKTEYCIAGQNIKNCTNCVDNYDCNDNYKCITGECAIPVVAEEVTVVAEEAPAAVVQPMTIVTPVTPIVDKPKKWVLPLIIVLLILFLIIIGIVVFIIIFKRGKKRQPIATTAVLHSIM